MGDGPLRRKCCGGAFGGKDPHYHYCFGAWDPSYSLTEGNLERCCDSAYSPAARESQPMLIVLPEEPVEQWYCIPIGKWAIPHQLLCYCGTHDPNTTIGMGGTCGTGGDYQELVVPRPTFCSGKVEFELKLYERVE